MCFRNGRRLPCGLGKRKSNIQDEALPDLPEIDYNYKYYKTVTRDKPIPNTQRHENTMDNRMLDTIRREKAKRGQDTLRHQTSVDTHKPHSHHNPNFMDTSFRDPKNKHLATTIRRESLRDGRMSNNCCASTMDNRVRRSNTVRHDDPSNRRAQNGLRRNNTMSSPRVPRHETLISPHTPPAVSPRTPLQESTPPLYTAPVPKKDKYSGYQTCRSTVAEDEDYEQPTATNYEQPMLTDYEQPTTVDYEVYERPTATDYEQPATTDYEQPAATDYEQPAATDYEQPAATDYEQPATTDYEQPSAIDYEQPSATEAGSHDYDVPFQDSTISRPKPGDSD